MTGAWLKNSCISALLLLVACGPGARRDEPVAWHTESAKSRPGVLVCLDAGHGGHDPGCKTADERSQEKDLALKTVQHIHTHLKNLGYQVVLTREDDTFVALDERAALANKADCTLFVSVHYNSAENTAAHGVEVFCFEREKQAEQTEACQLAHSILQKVIRYTGANSRGVKEANFAVLRETRMPAALVEAGFLTNTEEAKKLDDPRYLSAIAWGITQGIHAYIQNTE